jgi:hypothetical protein
LQFEEDENAQARSELREWCDDTIYREDIFSALKLEEVRPAKNYSNKAVNDM